MSDAAPAGSPEPRGPFDAAVTVVIVNYRTPGLTCESIQALSGERRYLPKLRAFVVDGGSADNSAHELSKYLGQRGFREWTSFLPLTTNGGFGWANNQAILSIARSPNPPDFIHLLNPDTRVHDGAVAELLAELIAHPRAGAAGSQMLSTGGSPVGSAFRFPSPGRELIGAAESEKLGKMLGVDPLVVRQEKSVAVDWVTGASVMFRTEALKKCGLFDDGFFLYFEEVELMHRLQRHGWKVRHVPASRVLHAEGASTGIGSESPVASLPAYWYASRRRYFALTAGPTSVLLADLGLIIGRAAKVSRDRLRPTASNCRARVGDLVRSGLLAKSFDLSPSASAWGDEPGKPPFWMKAR